MTKHKQGTDWRIVVTAIVAIAAIEVYALSTGYDGILLTSVIALLAGLAGWSLPQLKFK